MFRYESQKRIFDIFFSAVLIVCTLPIMLVIATIVFIDLRSVFFVQERIGQYGKPFKIWKFRTMRKASRAEEHEVDYSNNRTTKVGAFLRKTKLDELPQLFQVFWGKMSIVGPRPELEVYVKYNVDVFDRLLTIKPGLIDLSVIYFFNEKDILEKPDPREYYIQVVIPIKARLSLQTVAKRNVLHEIHIIFSHILTGKHRGTPN